MAEDGASRIRRLERRLERERAARIEAETIADRGMRQLWEANRELDRRVHQRTAELSKALEDLQVATSARDQLLTNMSHEVRTPLNGIVGTLELIGPHVDDLDGQRYLAAARSSANDLNLLISKLLLAVEAASGRLVLKPEPVSLAQLVEESREAWELKGMKLGYLVIVVCPPCERVNGHAPTPPQILIDHQRVRQVIDGMIEAVIEFSNPGAVKAEIGLDEETLVVSVSVSAESIDASIRDAFPSMLVGRGNSFGLTGHLVEALGGELSVGLTGEADDTYACTARITTGERRQSVGAQIRSAEPIGPTP